MLYFGHLEEFPEYLVKFFTGENAVTGDLPPRRLYDFSMMVDTNLATGSIVHNTSFTITGRTAGAIGQTAAPGPAGVWTITVSIGCYHEDLVSASTALTTLASHVPRVHQMSGSPYAFRIVVPNNSTDPHFEVRLSEAVLNFDT